MSDIEWTYLSGPMTGLPDYNRAAFFAKEAELNTGNRRTLNPAAIEGDESWTWSDWMREALRLQLHCDVVHMLPGWRKSRGARIERRLALILGQRVEGAEA